MTKYILSKDIETGLTASVPEHVFNLFPNLVETTEEEDCVDCVIDLKEPVEVVKPLQEPVTPRKKSKANE